MLTFKSQYFLFILWHIFRGTRCHILIQNLSLSTPFLFVCFCFLPASGLRFFYRGFLNYQYCLHPLQSRTSSSESSGVSLVAAHTEATVNPVTNPVAWSVQARLQKLSLCVFPATVRSAQSLQQFLSAIQVKSLLLSSSRVLSLDPNSNPLLEVKRLFPVC